MIEGLGRFPECSVWIVHALGEIGDRRAIEPVVNVLKNPRKYIDENRYTKEVYSSTDDYGTYEWSAFNDYLSWLQSEAKLSLKLIPEAESPNARRQVDETLKNMRPVITKRYV